MKYMKSIYFVETYTDLREHKIWLRLKINGITTATASDPSTSGTDKVV